MARFSVATATEATVSAFERDVQRAIGVLSETGAATAP